MKVGDKVRCLGIGYPGIKGEVFTVTVVFPDNKTFGILVDEYDVRLLREDFEVVED